MDDADSGKLEFWGVLELFGHSKIAGYVRQVSLGGDAMLRVDVPEVKFTRRVYAESGAVDKSMTVAAFTKFYSPKSVFAMTPVSEETARRIMQSLQIEPISPFSLREQAPALPAPSRDYEDDDEEDDDDDEDPGF